MENRELIERAIHYIQTAASDTALFIDTVAEHAGFSTDYFNRIFAAHTGFTVMEYVRFLRLRKASLLLRSGERDILDIALEVGYESHESFTRAFKKQYGRTPSEFRELEARDVHGCRDHSIFLFGLFHGETLVGLSRGALQRAHGFVVNNCVETGFADGCASEELYRCTFRFVTNAALARGALPMDDIQHPDTRPESRCGAFDSTELGYEVVLYTVELADK